LKRFIPVLALALMLNGCGREPLRMERVPSRVLWAWESPQDLRFLQHQEGVAFLGGELQMEGPASRWVPRRNPLLVNPDTPLLAVLRVESRRAALTGDQRGALVACGLRLLALPGVRGLQIDFDAKESERAFYAEALRGLRGRMPADTPLSITALASWCLEDRWLADVNLGGVIDEAVPMLFRMGTESARIRTRLVQGEPFQETLARASYGLSTDEPLPPLRAGRRCYVFHPGSWTAAAWDRIAKELP